VRIYWRVLVFVFVGISVSVVVDLAASRTREAAQAGAEAQTLATVAGGVLRGERPLIALLQRLSARTFSSVGDAAWRTADAGWSVAEQCGRTSGRDARRGARVQVL
jgi:two-component system sensor histidine kinase KdpD